MAEQANPLAEVHFMAEQANYIYLEKD